jgi:hypothetical protein
LNADLLIYCSFTSSRLQYVLKWIFTEQLNIAFSLTTDLEKWEEHNGPKIIYGKSDQGQNSLQIIPHDLLKEETIHAQNLSINRWKHSTILFYNQPGAAIPFDIFSAVFCLVSRYEEYLPHAQDQHGRFKHDQSVAAQFSFLQQPVVDEWLLHFAKILAEKTGVKIKEKEFRFQPTYDVDIAWKYLHKGAKRQWGGYFKDILTLNLKSVAERRAVLSGKQKDPYNCFSWLDEIHKEYKLQPLYFLLLGQLSDYDKNADPALPAMQKLMQDLSAQYDLGIHPSYSSHESIDILKEEINILANATHKSITKSRQHYIKFALPKTYETLIASGITDDYSMGYASCNGFRAGTSNSFPWYNLPTDQETSLRVHPFVFMDATSRFYSKQNPQEARKEWERLWHAVKKVNGTFISIWHNHMLGHHRESKDWRELYLKTLKQLTSSI